MRQRLGYNPDTTKEDGVFWMSFEDFIVNFRNVYVCRLFKTVRERKEDLVWNKYSTRGAWSVELGTAGGCPNEASCVRNPQYYVRVAARSTLFITLCQKEVPGELPPIGFKLLRKKGKRVRNVYQGEQVMGGAYMGTREVICCSWLFHPSGPMSASTM
jgi:Calpain large subunit, domain III/Calpain family cysteine protease